MTSEDDSHYLRRFGTDALAEFEDGEPLGVVHATMVRPFEYTDEESGDFENGCFWGLLEFETEIGEEARMRLARQDLVRLSSDPARHLPVPTLHR